MNAIIATVGMFDGVHLGHRHLLDTLTAQARERRLHPVVFTFDCHPQQVLRGRQAVSLLTTSEERLQMLHRLGDYEVVVVHFDRTMAALSAVEFYDEVMSRHAPIQALVMGYDNSFGNKQHNDFPQLRARLEREGVTVIDDVAVRCDGVEVSSTQIRLALQSGNVSQANAMLGYRYSLSGTVTAGRHIGHTLGFPTANLDCRTMSKLMPADGVYALTARCEGESWHAVANLGTQPTVGGQDRVLEVHLLDECRQLYGRLLQVEFVARLRDIRPFDSHESLAHQIQQDIEQCRSLF